MSLKIITTTIVRVKNYEKDYKINTKTTVIMKIIATLIVTINIITITTINIKINKIIVMKKSDHIGHSHRKNLDRSYGRAEEKPNRTDVLIKKNQTGPTI